MRQPKEVLANWIETIQTEGRVLSKWEEDFIESLSDQFAARGTLSEKQEEILERIYAEKTA